MNSAVWLICPPNRTRVLLLELLYPSAVLHAFGFCAVRILSVAGLTLNPVPSFECAARFGRTSRVARMAFAAPYMKKQQRNPNTPIPASSNTRFASSHTSDCIALAKVYYIPRESVSIIARVFHHAEWRVKRQLEMDIDDN